MPEIVWAQKLQNIRILDANFLTKFMPNRQENRHMRRHLYYRMCQTSFKSCNNEKCRTK